ncbi:MAG: zf-TFIIB domain-containing protein [Planctomycetota bacterium]
MHCPKCRKQLLERRALAEEGVAVDFCAHCKGAWFDGKELESVLDVAARNLKPLDDAKESGLLCPRCGHGLVEFDYPQTYVTVDMCGNCNGLWLDAGEFREMKIVREALEKKRTLERVAPPTGAKGAIIGFIDRAIERLATFK